MLNASITAPLVPFSWSNVRYYGAFIYIHSTEKATSITTSSPTFNSNSEIVAINYLSDDQK